ncbi:threonine/serine exporter family protein [soil metagenome]
MNGFLSGAKQLADSMRKEPPSSLIERDSHASTDVAAMLRELGMALVEVEQPTHVVAARLMAVARRYTAADVRVVVLPRLLFIQVGTVGYEVDVTTRATAQLNVAGAVDDIAELAAAGAITPADAVAALRAVRSMTPRFGPVVRVVGYAITTVGFGMLTDPTWRLLGAYALLGAVVGVVELLGRPFPRLAPVLPTAAATVVTILATLIAPAGGDSGLLRLVGPALVAILPGIALTLGAMELAGSSIVAGASRLVYGVVQLMLIVFGVSLGLHVVSPGRPHPASAHLGSWSADLAILVIAVGLYIHLSAPHGSLAWIIAAVGLALVGQKVGGLFVSTTHAGAIGAFLVVPFAAMAARVKTSPPALVMMLAAFWALVPSAVSFESLGDAVTLGSDALPILSRSIAAIFSIALGTLVGWSVFNPVSATEPSADGAALPGGARRHASLS